MPTKSEIGTNGIMEPVREHYQAAETSRRMRGLKTLGPVPLASVGKAGRSSLPPLPFWLLAQPQNILGEKKTKKQNNRLFLCLKNIKQTG